MSVGAEGMSRPAMPAAVPGAEKGGIQPSVSGNVFDGATGYMHNGDSTMVERPDNGAADAGKGLSFLMHGEARTAADGETGGNVPELTKLNAQDSKPSWQDALVSQPATAAAATATETTFAETHPNVFVPINKTVDPNEVATPVATPKAQSEQTASVEKARSGGFFKEMVDDAREAIGRFKVNFGETASRRTWKWGMGTPRRTLAREQIGTPPASSRSSNINFPPSRNAGRSYQDAITYDPNAVATPAVASRTQSSEPGVAQVAVASNTQSSDPNIARAATAHQVTPADTGNVVQSVTVEPEDAAQASAAIPISVAAVAQAPQGQSNQPGVAQAAQASSVQPNTPGVAQAATAPRVISRSAGFGNSFAATNSTAAQARSVATAATASTAANGGSNPNQQSTSTAATASNQQNTQPVQPQQQPQQQSQPIPIQNPNGGSTGGGSANGGGQTTALGDELKNRVEQNVRAQAAARGRMVLGADEEIYMVSSNGVSEGEAKKEAQSLAFQAIKEYDDRLAAERRAKAQDRAVNTKLGRFLGRHKVVKAVVGVPGIVVRGTIGRGVDTIKRTVTLKNYYKAADEAIKASGQRSVGQAAIDRIDEMSFFAKNKVARAAEDATDDYVNQRTRGHNAADVFNSSITDEEVSALGGMVDPDRAMIDRAVQASRGYGNDTGIKFENAPQDNELTRAVKEFARQVADYDLSVDSDPDTSQAAIDRRNAEMQKRAAARKAVVRAINEHSGGAINNATDVVRLIERNLSGTMHAELQDAAVHDEALQAIDQYIDEHFHFNQFKVTKSGLTASEEDYAKMADKLAIKTGVVAGIVVALGSSYAMGFGKNFVIQHITDSQVVMAGAKVLAATGIGFARGKNKARKDQLKDNVEAALGGEVKKNAFIHRGREKYTNFNSLMLDVDAVTADLVQSLGDIENGNGINESVQKAAIKQIGEILARQQLETRTEGKIRKKEFRANLFKYHGRDNVERSKANMYKAMNDVIEYLNSKGVDTRSLIEVSVQESRRGLEEAYGRIRKEQIREQYKAAARDGAIAGAAAIGAIIGVEFIKNKYFGGSKLLNEWKEIRSGDKKIWFRKTENGHWILSAVSTEKGKAGAVAAGAVADQAIDKGQNTNKGQNANKAGDVEQKSGAGNNKGGQAGEAAETHEVEKTPSSDKPVIVEDDPKGGQAVGIDKNGNGKLDEAWYDKDGKYHESEYIAGGDKGRGYDLSNNSDVETLKRTMEKEGITVETNDVVVEKPHATTRSDFINSQSNLRKDVQVDWNKSGQKSILSNDLTRISGDGEPLYVGHVDMIDGQSVPAGTVLLLDPTGNGKDFIEVPISSNGEFTLSEEVLKLVGGDKAKLAGLSRVGTWDGDKFISYTTNKTSGLDASEAISTTTREMDRAITFMHKGENGQNIINAQTAVCLEGDNKGHTVSNLSEVFSGRDANSLPYFVKGSGRTITINGKEIETLQRTDAAYAINHDSNLNYPFKGKERFGGTPWIVDANKNGTLEPEEAVALYGQMTTRAASDPWFMMQEADGLGLFKPENMAKYGITTEDLMKLGVTDGMIDTDEELNLVLEALKRPENALLLQKISNATTSIMDETYNGCTMELVMQADRITTYSKGGAVEITHASAERMAIQFRRPDGTLVKYQGTLLNDGNEPGTLRHMTDCGGQISEPRTPKVPKTPPPTNDSDPTDEATPPPSGSDPTDEATPPPSGSDPTDEATPPPKSDPTQEGTYVTEAIGENGTDPAGEGNYVTEALDENLTPKNPRPIDDNMRPNPEDGTITPNPGVTEPPEDEPPFDMTPPEGDTGTPTIGAPGGEAAPIMPIGEVASKYGSYISGAVEDEEEKLAA